jgi:endonuclease III
MARYFTRAAALADAVSGATGTTINTAEPPQSSSLIASAQVTNPSAQDAPRNWGRRNPVKPAGPAKRARKTALAEMPTGMIELPHNLGTVPVAPETLRVGDAVDHLIPSTVPAPGPKSPSASLLAVKVKQDEDLGSPTAPSNATRKRTSKKPKRAPYGLTPGVTPFPDWPHPTPAECEEVHRLLTSLHGEIKAPAALPNPSLTISGCGEVPCVLDALLRTVLSGATTKGNSGKAFEGLVKRFGVKQAGIGKGSVDWEKVRNTSVEDVEEAIKSGGLAAIKSKNIKLILDMVYEENLKRQMSLAETPKTENDKGDIPSVVLGTSAPKLAADLLSLNHVHSLSKDEAMLEFVKYPGIGVKTAACVVLFSLQRPCFAVDTHVFRLSKWLGWLPQDKRVDEITAFRHLEVLVPDHLKYALHQLFLEHGKTCPRCRASTGDNTDATCVIDHLITVRTGKRKGKNGFGQTQLSF